MTSIFSLHYTFPLGEEQMGENQTLPPKEFYSPMEFHPQGTLRLNMANLLTFRPVYIMGQYTAL